MIMKWISVKDRLPNDEGEVVLVYKYDGIDIVQRYHGVWLHYDEGNVDKWEITHWMPLPEPPKK